MKQILNILFFWLCCLPFAEAQTKVQVVTKTARQEMETQGKPVVIRLNKSRINIAESAGENVEVIWRIITKNADKTTAEKETGFVDYSLRRTTDEITIDYELKIPRGYGKLKSLLEIEVDVKIPRKSPVKIFTQLSSTEGNSLQNSISADLKFGSLKLINYRGNVSLKSSFADVECQSCDGNINATLEKAGFFAKNLKAKTTIASRFGEVQLQPVGSGEINVNAYRSAVTVSVRNPDLYAWNVANKFAEINVSDGYKEEVTTYLNNRLFDLNKNINKPRISVTNQYEPISIIDAPISIIKK